MGLEFRVLGSLAVLEGESVLPVRGGRQRALLAILLLNANRVVSSHTLLEELWGEQRPASGLTALQHVVSRLRGQLEPGHAAGAAYELIVSEGPGYRLRVAPGKLDLERFESLVAEGRRALASGRAAAAARMLRHALSLWDGPALADLAGERFVAVEARRLEELRLEAVEERIEADLALGRHRELVAELETLVAEQPLRERPWRHLMLALYRSGRQAEALAAYQAARRTLDDELGLQPSEELRQLERAILGHDASLASQPGSGGVRTNLPAPATSLVGRERELADLCHLLTRAEVRLLTVSGPGGVGKSRLALEAAASVVEEFEDGVFLVELATLREPELLPAATAAVLGVAERPGETPAETLATHLHGRRILLLLDNFEHLLAAAPLLGSLLATASDLTVLATSRAPLRLNGEHEYPLPPLAEADALTLFAERAHAASPDFQLADSNREAVTEICARLDRLPLALELAAARSKLLTPQALRKRLAHPLDLLVGGRRDLAARQQTLRATIEWSHDLLQPAEQQLLARLAVFAGGCTTETADAVCNGEGPTLDRLGALLDNSLLLVRPGANGEPRFQMLDTIHEYAHEQLQESREAETVRRRHAEHYLALAEQAAPELRGPRQQAWLERVDAEHENFRTALAYFGAESEDELLLRLAAALWFYWFLRGQWSQGLNALEEALATEGGARAVQALVEAFQGSAQLAVARGDFVRVRTAAAEALRLSEALRDGQAIARALRSLGYCALHECDYDQADELWQRSLGLFREAADWRGVVDALWSLMEVSTHRGDVSRAMALLKESERLLPELGEDLRALYVLNLGNLALVRGDYERAAELSEQSRALHAKLGQPSGVAISLHNLAIAALGQQRLDKAANLFAESLRLAEPLGFRHNIRYCLEGVAAVAAARDAPKHAARLLGAAEGLGEALNAPLQAAERVFHDATVASVSSQLSAGAFAAAWQEGKATRLETAIAEALAVAGQTRTSDEAT